MSRRSKQKPVHPVIGANCRPSQRRTRRELIALRVADGRRLWSFPAEAPVLAADVVYTGGSDGRVYALRAGDARRLWRSEPFGIVAIQVVANGRIYVSSDNNANGGYNRLHTLRASDGKLLW